VKYETIGLIGAMDEEVERFLHRMEGATETVKAGIVFRQGEWNGKRVILCKSGVGKVNAAVCTQILIDTFRVEAVVFTGVAGALHPSLDIGDIVVSTDCMQHDMDVTALGFPKGTIPYAVTSVFPASPSLVEAAATAGETLYPGLTRRGRILSGDQFVASRELVKELHQELEGVCVEMEGASVAQVCHLNGIPFVILRAMSDKADGSAHINFPEFTKLAAERSAAIVENMLNTL
jgi:adenosylhomocysteine nucleosidase